MFLKNRHKTAQYKDFIEDKCKVLNCCYKNRQLGVYF